MVTKYKIHNQREEFNNKEIKPLRFLYNSSFGRCLLKIITKPFISKIGGLFLNTKLSKYKIKSFVKKNNIVLSDYEEKNYSSFNDFFTRKIKKDKRPIEEELISPCDSKLLAYMIKPDNTFYVKGHYYSVNELIKKDISEEYKNGYCLIFRLESNDYHRYCYIDDCTKKRNVFIKGKLHTVQDVASRRYSIYKENSREYTILETKHIGKVIQIEVGALLIGKINNFHQEGTYKKGQEKGMFEFGGSTIVLLIKNGKIQLDEDILRNSDINIETKVKYGEHIGNYKK